MPKIDKDPISLDGIKRYSLKERKSKVDIRGFARPWKGGSLIDWLNSLSDILCSKDLKEIVKAIGESFLRNKLIILGMGAHPIKLGLSPIIIDLMKRGIISAIAMNGAGIIHDTEIAMVGRTSEDVLEELRDGMFGMAEETGKFLNNAIKEGKENGLGLGEAVGMKLLEEDFPYLDYSILANAYRLNIPATVHVAIGTDIIHMHPEVDPEAIGDTSHRDFRIFSRLISQLDGGVFINLGSAVIIPEVFLKSLSLVRNLGYNIYDFTSITLDFKLQYRAMRNVVQRPTAHGGRGYYLVGHNEIMFPLISALVIEYIEEEGNANI